MASGSAHRAHPQDTHTARAQPQAHGGHAQPQHTHWTGSEDTAHITQHAVFGEKSNTCMRSSTQSLSRLKGKQAAGTAGTVDGRWPMRGRGRWAGRGWTLNGWSEVSPHAHAHAHTTFPGGPHMCGPMVPWSHGHMVPLTSRTGSVRRNGCCGTPSPATSHGEPPGDPTTHSPGRRSHIRLQLESHWRPITCIRVHKGRP